MSDLYKKFVQAGKKATPVRQQTNRPQSVNYSDLEKAVEAIVAAYPAATPDFDQVSNGGLGKDGKPVKRAFFRIPASDNAGKNGTIVLYATKAIFTNVPAVDLA